MRIRCPVCHAEAALAWADALMVRSVGWIEALDAPRIRQAFRGLAAHALRWPAPAEIWQYMPMRPEPKKLPEPGPTPEARERAREMLERARKALNGMA